MSQFTIRNLYPETSDNEVIQEIEDRGIIEHYINEVLGGENVIDGKIYVYQYENDYIVFSVHQPSLEDDKYDITIISMSVLVRMVSVEGCKRERALTMELNHLMCNELRYTLW